MTSKTEVSTATATTGAAAATAAALIAMAATEELVSMTTKQLQSNSDNNSFSSINSYCKRTCSNYHRSISDSGSNINISRMTKVDRSSIGISDRQ